MCEDKLKKKEVQWSYMYNFCRKKIRDKSSCTILVHDAIVSRWPEKEHFNFVFFIIKTKYITF